MEQEYEPIPLWCHQIAQKYKIVVNEQKINRSLIILLQIIPDWTFQAISLNRHRIYGNYDTEFAMRKMTR